MCLSLFHAHDEALVQTKLIFVAIINIVFIYVRSIERVSKFSCLRTFNNDKAQFIPLYNTTYIHEPMR